MNLSLQSSLEELKGVGEARAAQLHEAGISNISDLLDFWPRRYIDYSNLSLISNIKPGFVAIRARVVQVGARWAKSRNIHLTEAIIEDQNGDRMPVVWFNQPFRKNFFQSGREYYFSGEFKFGGGSLSLSSPNVEEVSLVNEAPILPIYSEKKGLNSKLTRSLMLQAVELTPKIEDIFNADLRKEFKLKPRGVLIAELHFPSSLHNLEDAKRQLALEELIILRLAVDRFKLGEEQLRGTKIQVNMELIKKAVGNLPFELTDSQRRASWQILQDLDSYKPMNRMLMGDVGSGKTLVAALAALATISAGHQAVILAPTEVLARQHFKSILSLIGTEIPAECSGLLLGSAKPASKSKIHQQISSGRLKLIVATHAILSDKVKFRDLALVVVDEQHRFGVQQRRSLQKEVISGAFPHLLTMSATPIPRSLSLILYGELDQTVLKEKPAARGKVSTKLVAGASRQIIEDKIEEQLAQKNQIFVVCPAITDTEASERVSVESVADKLQKKASFRAAGIGVLHAKLPPEQKEEVMADFVAGKFGILVSTTVIEVGVDIPSATVMVIEGGEFFGLAQLHQLRGRIGRSDSDAWCYVTTSGNGAPPDRLRYFEQESDGFKLAEYDLKLRGPGQIYGKLQSGGLDLRMIDLEDHSLINEARAAANKILEQGLMNAKLKLAVQRHQGLESLN